MIHFIGSNVTFGELIENEVVQKNFVLLHDRCVKQLVLQGIRAVATF